MLVGPLASPGRSLPSEVSLTDPRNAVVRRGFDPSFASLVDLDAEGWSTLLRDQLRSILVVEQLVSARCALDMTDADVVARVLRLPVVRPLYDQDVLVDGRPSPVANAILKALDLTGHAAHNVRADWPGWLKLVGMEERTIVNNEMLSIPVRHVYAYNVLKTYRQRQQVPGEEGDESAIRPSASGMGTS